MNRNYIRCQSVIASASLLHRCIGRTVSLMRRDRFFFEGVPDDTDAGSLELTFDDGFLITLKLNSDGESSCVTDDALIINRPFDLDGGAHCSWQEYRLTDQPEWSNLLGMALIGADAIIDRLKKGSPFVSGWRLFFSNGQVLVYYNCGDDARILPNKVLPEEPFITTEYVPVDRLMGSNQAL